MKPVTRAVASRASRRHTRRRGPSHDVPTMAMATGTATARAAAGSIDTSTTSATVAATAAPDRSSHTSSTMARSWTSSRKRLTASPGAPGSRPAVGPGSSTSDRSRLTRGTVCQPTQQPCHCTAMATSQVQRTASMPTTPAISAHTPEVLPSATRSRATFTRRPVRSGSEKKTTQPNHVVR